MIVVCAECGRSFDDFNYLKGLQESKVCDDCRIMLELAMNEDDYSIFEDYLSKIVPHK